MRQLWCAVSGVAQENSSMSLFNLEEELRLHVKTADMTWPVWILALDRFYTNMQTL